LANQYITILEVGGAYTHKFKEILSFLKLKTLVVTDIDSVNADGKRCKVNDGSNGETTSNHTLKDWIPCKTTISDLLGATTQEKIDAGIIRAAYQTEENGSTGRSFEEAFLISNKELLNTAIEYPNGETHKPTKEYALFRKKGLNSLDNKTPYKIAPTSSRAKTNFAFDTMSFPENVCGQWTTPKYIDEGLKWLVDDVIEDDNSSQ
ncbi:MAG: hypothetical protein KDC67_03360, partial [Ignavibacteriae bacterium]|nr:hypothetical protein [Ignavibacteriota bacterium]